MPKNLKILFCLAFLTILCFQSSALTFSMPNSFRKSMILNAHKTSSSGIIAIKTDSNDQFYVEADLSPTNNGSVSDTVRITLSIANSESVVAENCLAFNFYNCSSHTCNKLPNTTAIDFPSFRAHVTYSQSPVSLDTRYWSLSPSNYLYIAYSCVPGSSSSSLPSGLYGALGLGTGNGASNNFGYSPIFSILMNSDLTGGKLLFKKDIEVYAKSPNALYTFSANTTWQIPAENGSIRFANSSIDFSGNIVFDVNTRAIGLPSKIFNSFVAYFNTLPNVSCSTSDVYMPYCHTTSPIEDLPDVTLSINGDLIKIPRAIYVHDHHTQGSYKFFDLNLKLISPSYYVENYVSPSFKDSIILDANFMSYYYTVFDGTSGSNYIYIYPSINAPSA